MMDHLQDKSSWGQANGQPKPHSRHYTNSAFITVSIFRPTPLQTPVRTLSNQTSELILLNRFIHTYHSVIGNTASSQPVQSIVQSLVVGKNKMTTLYLHNDTLTYILISYWGVLIYYYRKPKPVLLAHSDHILRNMV